MDNFEVVIGMQMLVLMLEDFVSAMLDSSERQMVVIKRQHSSLRYVQLLAYEHGRRDGRVAALEAIAVDSGEELEPHATQALRDLGWPEPDIGGNHRIIVEGPSPSAHDLAWRLIATLKIAFNCSRDESLSVGAYKVDRTDP